MGRPKMKRSDVLREHLDVKLTTAEKRVLAWLANESGITMSAYARELIREELARKTGTV